MDIDMSGMRYVMGLGSGLSGPATAVSHNSRRCIGFFSSTHRLERLQKCYFLYHIEQF